MTDRGRFLVICGLAGLFGCLALFAGNVAGIIVVERHDWVSDTISDLAAGRHAWIQDFGLVMFALGLLACGVGLFRWRLDGVPWKAAASLLIVASGVVALIAMHNEYGDGDHERYVIHMNLVYGLSAIFAFLPALTAPGLKRLGRGWAQASVATSVLWVIFAPIYFFVPERWMGAYERGLGLILVGWVAMLAWLLWSDGRRGAANSPARKA